MKKTFRSPILHYSLFGLIILFFVNSNSVLVMGEDTRENLEIVPEPGESNTTKGTDKSDVIIGNSIVNTIKGKDADDVLMGRQDNDFLYGNRGNDILQGNSGADVIFGDEGDDVLEGEMGKDYFDCGGGYDVIVDFRKNEGDVAQNNCEEIRINI